MVFRQRCPAAILRFNEGMYSSIPKRLWCGQSRCAAEPLLPVCLETIPRTDVAVDREGVGVLDAEDAFSVKIYLCLGLSEVLLEHLWVPDRKSVV